MVATRVGGHRADKRGMLADSQPLVIRIKLFVRWKFQVRWQSVEPVFGTVNLSERFYPLPSPGKEVLVIVSILAVSQAPLPQIVDALNRTGF